MSVQVSYKKQFLIYLLLFLILAVAAEIGSRIYEYEQPSTCGLLNSEAFTNVNDSLKNQICQDMNEVSFEKPSITILKPNQHFETINVNSFGFRGDEILKEKSEGTYRIFLVGGSTLFGWGSTSDQNTISGFLQKMFNAVDKKVEIINAGVPGANSIREIHYIKNFLLEFNPDMIIIYDGVNDASNAIINKNDLGKAPENEMKEIQKNFNELIKTYLQMYRTPFVLNYLIFVGTSSTSYDTNSISEMKENWVNRWTDVCEWSDSKKIKVMVTLQPALGTGNKTLYADEIVIAESKESQMLVKAINELQFPLNELSNVCFETSDLREVFNEIKSPIFWDNQHMNDLGNKIVAEKLFEIINTSTNSNFQ
jgi:lysophospholipase L1-like esterase